MAKVFSGDADILTLENDTLYSAGEESASDVLLPVFHAEKAAVLNQNEYVSIRSLVAYVAKEKGICEDAIHLMTTSHFNVSSLDQILSRDFEAAVRYLVDLTSQYIH